MPHQSYFKHDLPSRFETKLAKQHAAEAQEREVYAAVTQRDQRRCRCCGDYASAQALGTLKQAHHHHIVYRSAGGPTSSANLCLLCARCHSDEHQHRLKVEGDANCALTFWKRQDNGNWYVWKQEVAPHVTARD